MFGIPLRYAALAVALSSSASFGVGVWKGYEWADRSAEIKTLNSVIEAHIKTINDLRDAQDLSDKMEKVATEAAATNLKTSGSVEDAIQSTPRVVGSASVQFLGGLRRFK